MNKHSLIVLAFLLGVVGGILIGRIPLGAISDPSSESEMPEGTALIEGNKSPIEGGTSDIDSVSMTGLPAQFVDDEARGWHRLGNIHIKAGRYDEAIVCYEKAAHAEPSSPEPLSSLAAAQFALQNYTDAKANWEKAFQIDDGNFRVRSGLASIAYIEKRYDDAIEIFEQLHKEYPRSETYLWGLAQCYESLGNNEKAVENYRRFVAISSNSKNVEFAEWRIRIFEEYPDSPGNED